jgi:UDP-glucuronate 4-epimerase
VPRILVTGGAGFLGSHLCERLLARGDSVVVLDNLDPFYDPQRKRENLDLLREQGGASFVFAEADIRDGRACREALRGVDAVVHLAALAGVRPSIADPVRYMDVNVAGTQTLLQQIDSPAIPVVFGSSSSVYGASATSPFAEDDVTDQPLSPYAASKKAGEVLCFAWRHLKGNPVACLRFFTVYGPRQRPEMAIHRFAHCIAHGVPLPFFGDGSSRRDYTYVADIVDGIVRALDRAHGFFVCNLGGSATTSLQELVAMIESRLGKKAILRRMPDQPGDVPLTCADITRATRELGWRCKTPIQDGIDKFCAWFEQREAAEAQA